MGTLGELNCWAIAVSYSYGSEGFHDPKSNPFEETEMSDILDILTIEIPDPAAYAVWLIGSPLLAWLAVTLFV